VAEACSLSGRAGSTELEAERMRNSLKDGKGGLDSGGGRADLGRYEMKTQPLSLNAC